MPQPKRRLHHQQLRRPPCRPDGAAVAKQALSALGLVPTIQIPADEADAMDIDPNDLDKTIEQIMPYNEDAESQADWAARKRTFKANIESCKCKKFRLKSKGGGAA